MKVSNLPNYLYLIVNICNMWAFTAFKWGYVVNQFAHIRHPFVNIRNFALVRIYQKLSFRDFFR